jgi:cyclohexanecarboxylate-CoA ligase
VAATPNEPETLPKLIAAAKAGDGDRVAIIDDAAQISSRVLIERSSQFAAGLGEYGIGPGDVVLIQLPNWWEAIPVLFGTWLRGAVACPIVSIYREHELDFIVRQIKPRLAVVPVSFRGCDHVDLLRGVSRRVDVPLQLVSVRAGDSEESRTHAAGATTFEVFGANAAEVPAYRAKRTDRAVVLYTSGTTADPKGVIHSHHTLLYESRSIAEIARLGPGDSVFMPSPLTHITGLLYGAILPIERQIPLVLMSMWNPDCAVDLIEQWRCTFSVGATPFLRGLTGAYETSSRTSSLNVYICGGADIPPELVRRARASLGTRVVRTYGSTELPTATITDPYRDGAADAAADTDGSTIGSVDVRLAEPVDGVGQLEARGPELFLGYIDSRLDGEAFTTDGYFRTGDLASIGRDGAITIRGRIKDIINRGGEKFSAKEVEEVLRLLPQIDDVAVIAVPDPDMVERACAFVVLKPGVDAPTLVEITRLLRDQGLAIQKAPEHLRIVDTLPMTATGKVQKFQLLQHWNQSRTNAEADERLDG